MKRWGLIIILAIFVVLRVYTWKKRDFNPPRSSSTDLNRFEPFKGPLSVSPFPANSVGGRQLILNKTREPIGAERVRDRFLERYPEGGWKMDLFGNLYWSQIEGDLPAKYWAKPPEEAALDFLEDHSELLDTFPSGTELEVAKVTQTAACTVVSVQGQYQGGPLPGHMALGFCRDSKEFFAKNNTPNIEKVEDCTRMGIESAKDRIRSHYEKQGLKIDMGQVIFTYEPMGGRKGVPIYVADCKLQPGQTPGRKPWFIKINACDGQVLKEGSATVEF